MNADGLARAVSRSPAGARTTWLLRRALDIASGGPIPTSAELEQAYAPAWLAEVRVAAVVQELASVLAAADRVESEASPRDQEVRVLLHAIDGSTTRLRCVVEPQPPHRIAFQLLAPALVPAAHVDRRVQHAGRSVQVRDFGGEGPPLLLWHGAGCDGSVWDAMAPHLGSFRVIAQDLPAHGASPVPRMSVADTIADAGAVVAALDLPPPIVVGHSLGGWAALAFAAADACRALVCLDGPTALDQAAMGIGPGHPAYLVDPPDVRAALAAVGCPVLIVLCAGASRSEQAWMEPFRAPLRDHLTRQHPEIRVESVRSDHMPCCRARRRRRA